MDRSSHADALATQAGIVSRLRHCAMSVALPHWATCADDCNNSGYSEGAPPVSAPPIVPVVLAGGSGTRLWPVSREAMPKQFLPLVGERSTYQQALLRGADPELFAAP